MPPIKKNLELTVHRPDELPMEHGQDYDKKRQFIVWVEWNSRLAPPAPTTVKEIYLCTFDFDPSYLVFRTFLNEPLTRHITGWAEIPTYLSNRGLWKEDRIEHYL